MSYLTEPFLDLLDSDLPLKQITAVKVQCIFWVVSVPFDEYSNKHRNHKVRIQLVVFTSTQVNLEEIRGFLADHLGDYM